MPNLTPILAVVVLLAGLAQPASAWSNCSGHVTAIRWNADSATVQVPAGRTCNPDPNGDNPPVAPCFRGTPSYVCMSFDDTEKFEGTASMKITNNNSYGGTGCDQGNVTLPLNWSDGSSPRWMCHYWRMKIDAAFDWDAPNVVNNPDNQLNIKLFKWLRLSSNVPNHGLTMHLFHDHINFEGNHDHNWVNYNFRPDGPNDVTNWHDYMIAMRMQSNIAVADGVAKFYVDGVQKGATATGLPWCDWGDCTGPVTVNWGSAGMPPYPQSPSGTIWLDDFEMTTGSAECAPR